MEDIEEKKEFFKNYYQKNKEKIRKYNSNYYYDKRLNGKIYMDNHREILYFN